MSVVEMLTPLSSSNALRELEVSVTHRCTLACRECGFLVPHQPRPQTTTGAGVITDDLGRLLALGVQVERLVLVGGEPTMAPAVLKDVCAYASEQPGIAEVEVVSNGLSPDRVDAELLNLMNRLVISNYLPDSNLVELWQTWAAHVAPRTTVVSREQDRWDQWTGEASVSADEALQLWRTCWYRKHCVTLERGRLFSCSRVPKLGRDDEGLPLDEDTTLADVRDWLNADRALPSCATCIPMMGFAPVPVAEQPDDRLARLGPRAERILTERIQHAAT